MDDAKFLKESHLDVLLDVGCHVHVPDYRGFADSIGRFVTSDVNLDIEACVMYLREHAPEGHIFLVTHSIGATIA